MVGHGAYVEWPSWVRGAHKFVNIRSNGNDCVPLSIAAHFIHDKIPYRDKHERDRALKHYRKKENGIKFPPKLTLPYTIHDFPEIEYFVGFDLWLYKLTKDHISKYEIILERMSTNSNVDKDRVGHTCAISNSNHAALIKNIDKYLKPIQHVHLYRENLANKNICKTCRMYQPFLNFLNDYNCCKSDNFFS